MADFDKVTLEKLDVDNYATWSVKMRYLLVAKGLWTPVTDSDQEGGARSDEKALALIGLYVKDHHLALLSKCKTAKEAWEELESVYKAKSNARRLQLKRELNALKKEVGEPVSKYVARATNIRDQLVSAGPPSGTTRWCSAFWQVYLVSLTLW